MNNCLQKHMKRLRVGLKPVVEINKKRIKKIGNGFKLGFLEGLYPEPNNVLKNANLLYEANIISKGDIERGLNGKFASLDQYGITHENFDDFVELILKENY